MPALHRKCDECGALLGPKAEEVPESILHEKTCRQYMAVLGWEVRPGVEKEKLVLGPPKRGTDHVLDDKWVSTSGASSSERQPAFHLIPIEGLISLAERFYLGDVKHGPRNYMKAITAGDDAWIKDRINHAIKHLLDWSLEYQGIKPVSGDDHAGAVAWFGVIMTLINNQRKEAQGGQRG